MSFRKPLEWSDHYTLGELASHLGVTLRTARRWAAEGTLEDPVLIVGRSRVKLWSPAQVRRITDQVVSRREKIDKEIR